MGLTYDPGCIAFLASLPPAPKRQLRAALDVLDDDPRDAGLDWKRLETPNLADLVFRLRVGDYRVVYVVRGQLVRVVRIFHRREGYSWLARLGF